LSDSKSSSSSSTSSSSSSSTEECCSPRDDSWSSLSFSVKNYRLTPMGYLLASMPMETNVGKVFCVFVLIYAHKNKINKFVVKMNLLNNY
jgi:hypothetical protein